MEQNFYIMVHGEKVKVTKEVYTEYYRLDRRMRYYEHDIKVGRLRKKNGIEFYAPSREDSIDRMAEAGAEPGTQKDAVLEEVLDLMEKQRLYQAIQTLNPEEMALLYQLYWVGISERELSRRTGIPQKTLNDRKRRLLKRLQAKLLEH